MLYRTQIKLQTELSKPPSKRMSRCNLWVAGSQTGFESGVQLSEIDDLHCGKSRKFVSFFNGKTEKLVMLFTGIFSKHFKGTWAAWLNLPCPMPMDPGSHMNE